VGTSIVKSTTSIASEITQRAPHILDIFSCQNGSVQISLPLSGAYRLSIFTLNGQRAFESAGNIGSAGLVAIPLKHASIPHGLYMMRLSNTEGTVSKKIAVTN
jgi:hypothetical protein